MNLARRGYVVRRQTGRLPIGRYLVLRGQDHGDGESGAGKTTVLGILHDRGLKTVDTDYGGWVVSERTGDEPRMARLLADSDDLVISGTVSNQGRFYGRFDHVVLLSAPVDVLLERVASGTNNPYGGNPEQRTEIAHYAATVEPLCVAAQHSNSTHAAPRTN